MNNRAIAQILFNIATLLKRQNANPYRVRRYREVARAILRLRHSLTERALAGKALGINKLGVSLTRKITVLAAQGQLDFYDDLCALLPPSQQRLLKIAGIGPILAERISQELGDVELATLLREAAYQRLTAIWGVGPQRADLIVSNMFPDDPPPPANAAHSARKSNVIYTQPTLWEYGQKAA